MPLRTKLRGRKTIARRAAKPGINTVRLIKKAITKYVGTTRTYRSSMRALSEFFPSQLTNRRCRMFSQVGQLYGTPATGMNVAYKGNSFHLAGPRINNSGAFTANVPSGLYYLFSSPASGGSVAPYGEARIIGSKITVKCVSSPSNGTGARLCIFPSNLDNSSTMSWTECAEQRRAKWLDIPAVTTGTAITLESQASSYEVLGVRPAMIEDIDYTCTPSSDPANLWYWQIYIQTLDPANTSNIQYNLDVTIEYLCDLLKRNPFDSAVPA